MAWKKRKLVLGDLKSLDPNLLGMAILTLIFVVFFVVITRYFSLY